MLDNSAIKSQSKILLFIMLICIVIISSIISLSFSVFVIQMFLMFITIILISKKEYKTIKLYIIIFCISMCFVFIVYCANNIKYGNSYYIGGSDDLLFEKQGLDIFYSDLYNPQEILDLGIIDRWSKHSFFVVYISILIRISELFDGYTTLLPRIINVYFLLWICMILEYLFRKYAFFTEEKINITITVFALTPNIQYINSHVFRDTFNLLQILLIIVLVDKLLYNKRYIRKLFIVAILIVVIYTTFYTRPNTLAFAGIISIFIMAEKMKIKKTYILIALIPIVIFSNFLEIIGLSRFIKAYNEYNLISAGDGLSSYIFRQPTIPFGIILRAFYAFITPFPNYFGLFKETSSILFDIVSFLIYTGVLISALFIPFLLKRLLKLDWLVFSFAVLFLGTIVTTRVFDS